MSSMWFVGTNDTGDRCAFSTVNVDRMWVCADGFKEGVFVSHAICGIAHQTLLCRESIRCVDSSEMLRFMRGEDVKQ